MSALYNQNKYVLRFLGTKGGLSNSHTNAYFFPDPTTLVFLDLSVLNLEKAQLIIKRAKDIRRVVVLVTHLHSDHASGVVMLGWFLQYYDASIIYQVVVHSSFKKDALVHFVTEGGSTGLYNVLEIGDFLDGRHIRPDNMPWLKKAIYTEHDDSLAGACGYVVAVDDTIIIYSGDSRYSRPFGAEVERIEKQQLENGPPLKVELYLEMSIHKYAKHLYWTDERRSIIEYLNNPLLKVVLMHYDDEHTLCREVNLVNTRYGKRRVFIAKEEKLY